MPNKIEFLQENADYIDHLENGSWGFDPYPTREGWRQIIKNEMRDFDFDDEFDIIEIDWLIEELEHRGCVA